MVTRVKEKYKAGKERGSPGGQWVTVLGRVVREALAFMRR